MTKEKLRIICAELDGWVGCVDIKCEYRKCQHLHKNGDVRFPEFYSTKQYPNYPEDLNAVHELEKKLWVDGDKWQQYKKLVWQLIASNIQPCEQTTGYLYGDDVICVSALLRCEALARLHGKWEEGE